MGRGNWYKKWLNNRSFIIENDRLKEKKYIFASFPRCDMHGFLDANVRPEIYADFYSRFLRMRDKNVLYPIGFNTLCSKSFIESKRNSNFLDDKIPNIYKETLEELGVGINEAKMINMRHNEYVSNLQSAFIDLYEKGYIEYKNTIVYFDETNNKIYDSLNVDKNKNYPRIKEKCFVLKIDNLSKQVAQDILKLDIAKEYKDKLIDLLEPKEVLVINLSLTNGNVIEIEIEHPEYLGAVSYILMNPEYVDIIDYTDPDEISSVKEYLENGKEPFAYTGISAINPLTGAEIPLFVSTAENQSFYLGMPGIREEDKIFALNAGFEIIDVISDGVLINSDFINGKKPNEAKDSIISAFIDAQIASKRLIYDKKEINLSSFDSFGALFPFLYDKAGMVLNPLKGFLPYNFNQAFRPQLVPNVDLLGNPLDGTMNNLFSAGMAPFISILYDEFNSDYQMLSDSTKDEYNMWLPLDFIIVDENLIIEELLIPIIIHNILKKELGYDLHDFARKVIISPRVYDNFLNPISKINNNLVDINKLLDHYYADSIRLYFLTQNINDKFIFNKYELEDIDKYVKYLRDALLKENDNETSNLDYYFADFANKSAILIGEHRIVDFINLLKEFSVKYIIKDIPSNDNILTFIRVIFSVMPYLAEEVYEKKFKGKYSIINEGWPV